MHTFAKWDEIDDLVSRMRLVHSEERYLVIVQERKFYVTRFLFDLIQRIQQTGSLSAFEQTPDSATRDALALQVFERVQSMSAQSEKPAAYIAFPITLLTPPWVERLARPLAGLFRAPLGFWLMGLAVLVNGWCLYRFGFGDAAHRLLHLSPGGLLLAYMALLGGLLLHELGHSAAALAGGLPARRIGAGFYLLLPVLFADVSHVWELGRMRRLAVNLGGVYFQLLFNVLLTAVAVAGPEGMRGAALDLVRINLGIVAYVLIPFLRNDGYWVLADLWDKPRLHKDARTAPYRLLRRLSGRRDLPDPGPALALYGALEFAFLVVTMGLFLKWSGVLFARLWHTARAEGLEALVLQHAGMVLAGVVPLAALVVLGTTLCKRLLKPHLLRSPA